MRGIGQTSPAAFPTAAAVDFTTAAYPEQEGFSYWQDEICRYLSPSITERIDREIAFAASLRRVVIGKAGVCDISFSPMRNLRDTACLRRMPDDDFFVAVMKAGSGKLEQRGRSTVLSPGDVVLYDSGKPFEWLFKENSRMIVSRISRRHMEARLSELDEMTSRPIRADHPLASIIGTTMEEMMRLYDPVADNGSRRLETTLIDLVTSSVEACLAPASRGLGEGDVLARAKAFLLDNIEDPDLDLDRLTRHLGVSVRTLCRFFANDGTTPIRWLWQQRLELAHRLLDEGRASHVSQIVMLCGFSDFSHFSRAFKKTYGVVPKSLLRREGK